MTDDFAEASKAKIRELEAAIASIKESLRLVGRAEAVSLDGHSKNKPTTWKVADDIERILKFGATSMQRGELIQVLVDRKLVRGQDEAQRFQYADLSIQRGLQHQYLKEDGAGAIHWIPGTRKSRVRKRL